jgi:subtilisin family serine protease
MKENNLFDTLMQGLILLIGYSMYSFYIYIHEPCTDLNKCITDFRESYGIHGVKTKYKTKVVIIDQGFSPLLTAKFNTFFNHTTQIKEHGTNVAGIVLGVNSNVELTLIAGGDHSLVNSIKVALEQKPDIINISLSSKGYSSAEKELIDANPNVLFVIAMGNDSYKFGLINAYPAGVDSLNVLRVASLDEDNKLLKSSNFGTELDGIGFLGKEVCALKICLTGTSQATPFITGFASIIKGNNPSISVSELKSKLKGFSKGGYGHYFGYLDIKNIVGSN